MLRKLRNKLSVRVFLSVFCIQIVCGALIMYALYLAIPSGVDAEKIENYETLYYELADRLNGMDYDEIGPVVDDFIRETGCAVALWDGDMTFIYKIIGSKLAIDDVGEYSELLDRLHVDDYESAVLIYNWNFMSPLRFSDRSSDYVLSCHYRADKENMLPQAIRRSIPAISAIIVFLAFVSSLLFTHFFVRPIRRIGAAAQRMTELDFSVRCANGRGDEIGVIAESLDSLSEKLESTLEELRQRNDALNQEICRANALEEQRSTFFSAAAHELKTPLSILDGQLTGMIDGVGVYRDRDAYLAKSLRNVRRMEHTVRDILAISRLQAGSSFPTARLDLAALVREQTETYAELAQAKDITVHAELPDTLPLNANAELVRDTVGAVLSNAVFYSPDGAEVFVTLRRDEENGTAAFIVENTGSHIDEEQLPHLFEAFYRVDRSRSRQNGGSGLGLYLVRLVTESLGGSCRMDNSERGVVTELSLPCEEKDMIST